MAVAFVMAEAIEGELVEHWYQHDTESLILPD
jgi:hypothetical protein